MKQGCSAFLLLALAAAAHAPLHAAITITSMTPSVSAPQYVGRQVVWTVNATDSNPGPLTFQFNVTSPTGAVSMVYDFNVGTLSAGVWTTQFVWATIAGEGVYDVQIVAKDFGSGETQMQSAVYRLVSRVSAGNVAVNATANPLVALFSAPACPLGSSMQATFQEAGSSVVNGTVPLVVVEARPEPYSVRNSPGEINAVKGAELAAFTTPTGLR